MLKINILNINNVMVPFTFIFLFMIHIIPTSSLLLTIICPIYGY